MAKWLVIALGIEVFGFSGLVTVAAWNDPDGRPIVGMLWSLLAVWVVCCGGLMVWQQNRFASWIQRIPAPETLRFTLAATLLASIEEAITTSLSNAAPLFGGIRGEHMITASTNYLEVILRHSVIVFVPMFMVWGMILSRYAVRPLHVFLIFGLTGTLAETISFGPQMLAGVGQWTFVYGLMVWLPALSMANRPDRRPPRTAVAVGAVVAPLIAAVPVVLIVAIF